MLSFDEKGRTAVKIYGGMKWMKKGYYHIPYNQKVIGLFDLFAARNIHTGEMHHKYYGYKNAFIVRDFYEYLLKQYPDKNIYIIRDNWSCHKAEATQIFVDLNSRLHDIPLPTCASWMNPIERDFSRIDNEVLKNSNFSSNEETQEMISGFIENELCSNGKCSKNSYRN